MKKLIAFLLVAAMLLCFTACVPDQTDDTEKEFTFTYNDVKITLNAPAEPIVEALGGNPKYSESTSCAFDGLDKSYGYGSFYLETYPMDGKDYVYGWYFVDDMVATNEGICIGSSQADVETAYGAENYNGSNAFQIKKGCGQLTIILEEGKVTSIQYGVLTD